MSTAKPHAPSRVRALLFPASDAACYSTNLPHNAANVEKVRRDRRQTRMPSPAPSADDRDEAYGIEEVQSDPKDQILEVAVVLRQKNDLHAFTFGSALTNYFVFQHDPAPTMESATTCYYNYIHCQFYPDPDSSDVWLKNCSTSMQSVKRRGPSSEAVDLEHGGSIALHEGVWTISLGEGVHFLCEVLPVTNVTTSLALSSTCSSTCISGGKTTQDDRRRLGSDNTLLLDSQVVSKVSKMGQRRHEMDSQNTKNDGTSRHLQKARLAGVLDATNLTLPRSNDTPGTGRMLPSTIHSRVEKQLRDDVLVAVKMCRRSNIPEAADMWLQEVKILKLLGSHDNIVSLLNSSTVKREIVLNYIPGQSVDKYTDNAHFSTLSEQQCLHIWQGSAAGLTWIHEKGILYNDLKPGNTMYDPERRLAVLIDFGVAAEKIDGHFIGGGTPWYVAPEFQLRQRHFVGDIWSLAIVVMWMLKLFALPDKTEEAWTLNRVFGSTPDAEKMIRWHRKIKALKAKIPARHYLLRRMLDPDPTARIESAELLSELSSATEHQPISLR